MIMPQAPSNNNDTHPATLRGVAAMMRESPVRFTREVGTMVESVGIAHEPPVTCYECDDERRDKSYPCGPLNGAMSVAFAWLMDIADSDI